MATNHYRKMTRSTILSRFGACLQRDNEISEPIPGYKIYSSFSLTASNFEAV